MMMVDGMRWGNGFIRINVFSGKVTERRVKCEPVKGSRPSDMLQVATTCVSMRKEMKCVVNR